MQKDIKDFKTQRSGRQRDLKKTTGFLSKTTTLHVHYTLTLFVHFFALFCMTTTRKCLFSRFKVMLHETIRNDDFSATQHCNIFATLFRIATTFFQHCNIDLCVVAKIVVANRLA